MHKHITYSITITTENKYVYTVLFTSSICFASCFFHNSGLFIIIQRLCQIIYMVSVCHSRHSEQQKSSHRFFFLNSLGFVYLFILCRRFFALLLLCVRVLWPDGIQIQIMYHIYIKSQKKELFFFVLSFRFTFNHFTIRFYILRILFFVRMSRAFFSLLQYTFSDLKSVTLSTVWHKLIVWQLWLHATCLSEKPLSQNKKKCVF